MICHGKYKLLKITNMNKNNPLNLSNWNYSYFNSEFFKAMISFVAEENDQEIRYIYSPTVLDKNEVEIFQTDFNSLDKAIEFMNDRYGHWSFIDPLAKTDGCSTCQAH